MRGVVVDVLQVFVAHGKKDDAAFALASLAGRIGYGFFFQRAERESRIGGTPTAYDDVGTFVGTVAKHFLGGAQAERRAVHRHEAGLGRCAHHPIAVGRPQSNAGHGRAVHVAGIALGNEGRARAQIPGLDHLGLQVGMRQVEARIDDRDGDVGAARMPQPLPGIEHARIGARPRSLRTVGQQAGVAQGPLPRNERVGRQGKVIFVGQRLHVGLGMQHQRGGLQPLCHLDGVGRLGSHAGDEAQRPASFHQLEPELVEGQLLFLLAHPFGEDDEDLAGRHQGPVAARHVIHVGAELHLFALAHLVERRVGILALGLEPHHVEAPHVRDCYFAGQLVELFLFPEPKSDQFATLDERQKAFAQLHAMCTHSLFLC